MAKQFDPYQAKDDVVNEDNNDSGAVTQSNTSEDINTDADASASEEICTTSMVWLAANNCDGSASGHVPRKPA